MNVMIFQVSHPVGDVVDVNTEKEGFKIGRFVVEARLADVFTHCSSCVDQWAVLQLPKVLSSPCWLIYILPFSSIDKK